MPEIIIGLMIFGLIGAAFQIVMIAVYNIQDHLAQRG